MGYKKTVIGLIFVLCVHIYKFSKFYIHSYQSLLIIFVDFLSLFVSPLPTHIFSTLFILSCSSAPCILSTCHSTKLYPQFSTFFFKNFNSGQSWVSVACPCWVSFLSHLRVAVLKEYASHAFIEVRKLHTIFFKKNQISL